MGLHKLLHYYISACNVSSFNLNYTFWVTFGTVSDSCTFPKSVRSQADRQIYCMNTEHREG